MAGLRDRLARLEAHGLTRGCGGPVRWFVADTPEEAAAFEAQDCAPGEVRVIWCVVYPGGEHGRA